MPINRLNTIPTQKSCLFSTISYTLRNRSDKWILPQPQVRYPDEIPKRKSKLNISPSSKLEDWQQQQLALKKKFPEGWRPPKRLSPDAMEGMRALNKQFPDYNSAKLASLFKVSPEAVRRILKSKWKPKTEAEQIRREERWKRRGDSIWSTWNEQSRILPKSKKKLELRRKLVELKKRAKLQQEKRAKGSEQIKKWI